MGRIKTKMLKRVTTEIYKKWGTEFSKDYEKNKEVLGRYADIPSKKHKNIISGYMSRLVKKRDLVE